MCKQPEFFILKSNALVQYMAMIIHLKYAFFANTFYGIKFYKKEILNKKSVLQ